MKSTTNHRWYRCSCRSLQRWSPSVRALLQCCGDQVQFHDTCLGFGWVRSIGKFSMAHPTSPSPLAPSFLSENLHFLWFQWHGKPFPKFFTEVVMVVLLKSAPTWYHLILIRSSLQLQLLQLRFFTLKDFGSTGTHLVDLSLWLAGTQAIPASCLLQHLVVVSCEKKKLCEAQTLGNLVLWNFENLWNVSTKHLVLPNQVGITWSIWSMTTPSV